MSANSESQLGRMRMVQVLSQYQVMIQAQARSICGDWQLAEDVYQEIAMILAKDPDAIPEDDGVIPWLREMTRRKSLEWGRKHRRMPQLLDEQILCQVADEVDAGERGAEIELKEQLEQCLDKMTEQQQDILYGRYHEGASGEELARRSGRTVQAIYAILKRARMAIERCVQQHQAGSHS